jgi:hypothetical protein
MGLRQRRNAPRPAISYLPGSRYRLSANTMSTMMTITTTVPMPIYMVGYLPLSG